MKRTNEGPETQSILRRTMEVGVRVMPGAFLIMLFVNLAVAILPVLGIRWSRSLYQQAQAAAEGSIQLGQFLVPLFLYASYLLAMKLYVIFYKRVSIQFGTLLSFEKQIKVILHDKCGRVKISNYENPSFYNRVWEAKVASINIYRIVECLIYFISIAVSVLALGGYIATIRPVFFLLVALTAIPSFTERIASGIVNSQHRGGITQLEKEERAHRSSLLDVSRYKEVRAYQIAGMLIERWNAAVNALQSTVRARDRSIFWIRSALGLIKTIATSGTYVLSAILFFSGSIDFSAFVATLAAAFYMQSQYTELFNDAGYFSEFLLLVKPFFQFMDMEDEHPQRISPQQVALVDVTYRYPVGQSDVLKKLSMRVNRGEIVAVVGMNGAGKSTLAKLLMGFLPPSAGNREISSNQAEIAECQNELSWIDCSIMFQDFCKYSLSVVDNIALGREVENWGPNLRNLAEQLGLALLIENKGVLGKEFGTLELSGGQWQRVAMARCFYYDKSFYLLDEPTSAIDPLQEKAINNLITTFAKGKTMVVISHRLSIARLADRVLVLDNGTIVQEGAHHQLLKDKSGLYSRLWAAQSTWYQE